MNVAVGLRPVGADGWTATLVPQHPRPRETHHLGIRLRGMPRSVPSAPSGPTSDRRSCAPSVSPRWASWSGWWWGLYGGLVGGATTVLTAVPLGCVIWWALAPPP